MAEQAHLGLAAGKQVTATLAANWPPPGVPPLFGFYAKFAVFEAAVAAGLFPLAVFGIAMSTIGAFYYLTQHLQFVLGYTPAEFGETLRSIAEGEIDVTPLVTAEVGLDGVPGAFEALADPEQHCKIIVTP